MTLESVFRRLFQYLESKGYAWEATSPDRLLRARKDPGLADPLVRYFGLGLDVSPGELFAEAFPEDLLPEVARLRPAVSRCGEFLVPHSHWPAAADFPEKYIYLGQETFQLLRALEEKQELIRGKSVLDLGSGAGALALGLSRAASRVLGVDSSAKAVEWSGAAARAHAATKVNFQLARIGEPEAEEIEGGFDLVISNPPLAVPSPEEARPHRDGGHLGIELPLMFLEYADRHLRPEGQVMCLATHPIVDGQDGFFERLDPSRWQIVERRRLHDYFNQARSRMDRYSEQGIRRIELWFLHLRKTA
jgi:SAM-dependent methyltransferase